MYKHNMSLTKEILEELNNSYLNINVKDHELIRPLSILKISEDSDSDEFYMRMAWLLRQPQYFYFLCKHILNVEILPFQAVILEELWNRKFPMLIGSRGSSKTFTLALYSLIRALLFPGRKIVGVGAAFRQSKYLFNYMYNIWSNAPILRSMVSGRSVKEPDIYQMIIGDSVVSFLPIGDGCLAPNTMVTYDDCFGFIKDANKKKMVWGNSKFREIGEFIDNGVKPTKIVTTLRGYSFEGTLNHAMKIIRNNDIIWCRVDQMKIGDKILIDKNLRWHNGEAFISDSEIYSLGTYCLLNEMDIPDIILQCSKSQMSNFILGVMSHGNVVKSSNKLFLQQLQYIFLHYGIVTTLEDNALIIREGKDDHSFFVDIIVDIKDSKSETFDIHVPNGNEYCANGFWSHNSKIRGERANDVIADEMASIPKEIFEVVISGFAAVSDSPVENVKKMAAIKKAVNMGLDPTFITKRETGKDNQIIISGSASYEFNHFAEYWKKWKKIVASKGNIDRLREIFGGDDPPEGFDWRDYSVIRLPFELLPKGMMSEDIIARSKATMHVGLYNMEYGACFDKDSNGFFKRSLIESCVVSEEKPILFPSGKVVFDALIKGNPNGRYVMGVDPASEVDNFSIVIIECHDDHRRIVYCWTINRKKHIEMVQNKLVEENNFYSYCARKIRQLMEVFPIHRICIDSQGGGIQISEALHDKNNLKVGELPIWEIITEKEKNSDCYPGLHILEFCVFARSEWVRAANHSLRKDFEDKTLLFPRFDPLILAMSVEEDKMACRNYDTLEDCIMEIEELKNELCLIEQTQTSNGTERWDVPEVKLGHGKKGRLRKDRYSALLMAAYGAREISKIQIKPNYYSIGGFAQKIKGNNDDNSSLYYGPEWFTNAIKGVY